MNHHMGCRLIGGIGVEVIILCLWDVELLCHGGEHTVGFQPVVTAEFHETQQQQRLLFRTNLPMQTGADGCYCFLCIQVIRHLISPSHVTVKIEVEVYVSDSEMMTQITN